MAQHNTTQMRGTFFLFLYYIRPFGLLAQHNTTQDGDMKFSMFEINLVVDCFLVSIGVPSKLIYFFEMFEFSIYMFSLFYFAFRNEAKLVGGF